jgi:hypothetical protein
MNGYSMLDSACVALENYFQTDDGKEKYKGSHLAGDVTHIMFKFKLDAKTTLRLRQCLRCLRSARGSDRNSAEEQILTRIIHAVYDNFKYPEEETKLPIFTDLDLPETAKSGKDAVFFHLFKIADENLKFRKPKDNFSGMRKALTIRLLDKLLDYYSLPNISSLLEEALSSRVSDPIKDSMEDFLYNHDTVNINHKLIDKYHLEPREPALW